MATTHDAPRVFSLWLVPDEPARGALTTLIASLAAAHGLLPFAPHVTVLGALTAAQVKPALLQRLAEATAPMHAPLDRVEAGADAAHWRWRCVYLRPAAGAEAPLRALHAAARTALLGGGGGSGGGGSGCGGDEAYMPHLSLAYSDCDEAARRALATSCADAALAAACGADELGARFCALQLWDTTAPQQDAWTLVGSWALRGERRGP